MGFSLSERHRIFRKYGPWAVVTGASSGIGRELAKLLAQAELNLILCARGHASLQALQEDLTETGVQVRIVPADLSESSGVETLLSATADVEVGLLVAAAGFGTSGSWLTASLEDELNMLRLNCGASLSLTHHFGGLFAKRGRGGIVLFGSLVGFQGTPYAAHYAATKAYIQSLAEALAVELKGSGVDILSAAPGPVQTGFADRARMVMNGAMTPETIGVPILKALGRRGTVKPGLLTKFLLGSLALLPRWGRVRVMALVMGGMTKEARLATAQA